MGKVFQKAFTVINRLKTIVPHHIETSQLICNAICNDGEHWSIMGENFTLVDGVIVLIFFNESF